jgi:hypothetical protein
VRARASALAGRDSRNAWRATCRLNVAKGGSRLARGWLVTPGRRLIRVDSPAYGVSPTRGAVTSMVRRRSTIRIRLRRDRVERRGGWRRATTRPDLPAVPRPVVQRGKASPRPEARRPAATEAQAARSGFNRRGVVTAPSHAYIRPSLGNAIATARQGPQGSCFLRPVSLASALQSTR